MQKLIWPICAKLVDRIFVFVLLSALDQFTCAISNHLLKAFSADFGLHSEVARQIGATQSEAWIEKWFTTAPIRP